MRYHQTKRRLQAGHNKETPQGFELPKRFLQPRNKITCFGIYSCSKGGWVQSLPLSAWQMANFFPLFTVGNWPFLLMLYFTFKSTHELLNK
jgi:hypothetical protein